jgi:peptidoglycan/xylan/chitin deacetylase (PgdA/CDA1 family)
MRASTVTAAAAAAAGTAWSLPALAPIIPSVCRALGVPRTLAGSEAVVAVTFDDGPHPEGTPAVLEALDRAGARASFFLVGEQVARHPTLAGEIAAAGHAIAVHGHRHRNQLRLAPSEFRSDLERGVAVIAEATGAAPSLYRPPYGIFSAGGLASVRASGLDTLLWSRWGRDWAASATPASITERLTRGLQAGDVLLLHDADHYSAPGSWRATAAALPRVLDEIARRGLRTVAY